MARQLRLRDNRDIKKIQKQKLYPIILLNLKTSLETSKNVENRRKTFNIFLL